jgi:hypothetical protein
MQLTDHRSAIARCQGQPHLEIRNAEPGTTASLIAGATRSVAVFGADPLRGPGSPAAIVATPGRGVPSKNGSFCSLGVNVRARRAATAERQAWAGEHVPRTARRGQMAPVGARRCDGSGCNPLPARLAYRRYRNHPDAPKYKGNRGEEKCKSERDDAAKSEGHANDEAEDVLGAVNGKRNRTRQQAQEQHQADLLEAKVE